MEISSLDPDASLDRLADLHHRFAPRCATRALELYVRQTLRVRVEREGGASTHARGVESGTAVRLLARDGSTAFASTSGAGASAVAEVIDAALRITPTRGRSQFARVPARSHAMRDLRGDLSLPSFGEVDEWIEAAQTIVSGRFRVDAALTVESLCVPELVAVRARTRAWAVWVRGARARSLVARRLEQLRPETWQPIQPDGVPRKGIGLVPPRLVGLEPEAASNLVRALVGATLSRPGAVAAAGSGWRLADDPRDPEALVGGTFDDAGFDTARVVLGDGRRIVGSIEGPGHFWRSSFRDLPRAQPANLVVEPSGEMPWDALIAQGVGVHVLAPDRWVLVLQHAALHADPGVRVPDFCIEIRPADLIERCTAAVGPAQRGIEGVLTPTLVFEGLKACS